MYSVLAFTLALFSVAQGDALRLGYLHEIGIEKVEIAWRDRTIPLVLSDDEWVAIIGVDLDRAAGDHPVPVTFTYADGRTNVRSETISVTPKEFPLTSFCWIHLLELKKEHHLNPAQFQLMYHTTQKIFRHPNSSSRIHCPPLDC